MTQEKDVIQLALETKEFIDDESLSDTEKTNFMTFKTIISKAENNTDIAHIQKDDALVMLKLVEKISRKVKTYQNIAADCILKLLKFPLWHRVACEDASLNTALKDFLRRRVDRSKVYQEALDLLEASFPPPSVAATNEVNQTGRTLVLSIPSHEVDCIESYLKSAWETMAGKLDFQIPRDHVEDAKECVTQMYEAMKKINRHVRCNGGNKCADLNNILSRYMSGFDSIVNFLVAVYNHAFCGTYRKYIEFVMLKMQMYSCDFRRVVAESRTPIPPTLVLMPDDGRESTVEEVLFSPAPVVVSTDLQQPPERRRQHPGHTASLDSWHFPAPQPVVFNPLSA